MSEFFEKDVFVVLSKSKEQVEKILEQVETAGGLSARNITKKVTLVICEDVESFPKECQDAEKLSIPLVLPNYVSECVTKGKRLDIDGFVPVTKKAKIDPPPPPSVDSSTLDVDSEWTGTASSEDFHPFILKVSTRNANEFTGIMEWPTLDNGKVIIKGDVDTSGNVKWEGIELVEEKGKDTSGIEVSVNYEGKLEKESTIVIGSFIGKSSKGKFKMSVTKRKTLPFIKAGAEFKGVFKMSYPFNMNVENAGDAKSDGCFGGTIVWPSIGSGNETAFKGVKTGDNVTWQEYLIKKGSEVEVPVNYDGKLESSKVTGKCKGSSESFFELTPA
eukprot:TRINITY_DN9053_c0_g1_i1.p1 TRINITY_DN9053_c0_g1~~TRINITY_DN9053_c0_g1_i1.p1  ORF type:complete len:387 (-),score=98.06 TRINITY_DN9053_c0_g1_i1:67-1059(-)